MRKLNLAIILISILALSLASCASQPTAAVEETQPASKPAATEAIPTEEPPMETEEPMATEEMVMETEAPMQTEEAAMAETEAVAAASQTEPSSISPSLRSTTIL